MWAMLAVTVSDVWTLYMNRHGGAGIWERSGSKDGSLVCLLDYWMPSFMDSLALTVVCLSAITHMTNGSALTISLVCLWRDFTS